MPPLIDAKIKAQFEAVLADWNYTGFVTAKEFALDWIKRYLPGKAVKDIARAMHLHLQAGGVIDQVPEMREEWKDWPFHYDFRLSFEGRNLYIETILLEDRSNDPIVHIVSIHDV